MGRVIPSPAKHPNVQAVDNDAHGSIAIAPVADALPPDFRDGLIRFWLLQYLDASPGCRTNETILREYLDHIGAPLHREALQDQLHWLAIRGCVEIEIVDFFRTSLMVIQLTGKGEDAVKGATKIEGIARRSL